MLKQKILNRWLWRWHIIAGLITLPIILLLSVTGIIYLFKAHYNESVYDSTLFVEPSASEQTQLLSSLDAQLQSVKLTTDHPIMAVFPPVDDKAATGFRLHSQGHSRNVVYVNPYTNTVTGEIKQKDTLMYTVRKLHGELLLGQWGTWAVELVASWFIVLIFTGLYIWWPAKHFKLSGFFAVRLSQGRKTFWRDVHAVLGFWLSIFMLIILAGGMPWTDVFGGQLKWVQEKTNTGYPEHWRSSKGLSSVESPSELPSELSPQSFSSQLPARTQQLAQQKMSLDEVMVIAKTKHLSGALTIKMPMSDTGVYTVSNRSFWLSDQKVFHLDQYTGNIVKAYDWSDVGILMNLRQVFMRLHQGEYGLLNWLVILIIALLFTLSSLGGLVSYLWRKPKGRWGLPRVPDSFQVGTILFVGIIILGAVFPLFGASLGLIFLYQKFIANKKMTKPGKISAASECS